MYEKFLSMTHILCICNFVMSENKTETLFSSFFFQSKIFCKNFSQRDALCIHSVAWPHWWCFSDLDQVGVEIVGEWVMKIPKNDISLPNIPHRSLWYVLVAVGSSRILFGKQKLGVTFNSDKQDVIDFTKISKMTMCRA